MCHALAVACALNLWAVPPAAAHTLGEGYLFLNVADGRVHGRIEITLNDLDKALPLDTDRDGLVSDEEFAGNIDAVRDYVASRVSVRVAGGENVIQLGGHTLERLGLGKFAAIDYDSLPLDVSQDLIVRYDMIFDADESHRGFLVLQSSVTTGESWEGEGEKTLVFTPGGRERILPADGLSLWDSFRDFFVHGVWHIWIGVDHILFLVALVLPSVLIWNSREWRPVNDVRSTLWAVVKVVTLFTIAHTITLTLATLSIVELPSRLVESVIAASVAFAALNNVYPLLRKGIGYVVFAFGLFHGFGFASVLQDLIVSPRTLAVDLIAFNVGVEVGQIAIVAVVVPVLFVLRSQRFYVPAVLRAGSAFICLLAILWLVERSLNFELLA